MPKYVPASKFQELKGLDRISQVVHEMQCIWREISKDDIGIDGEIDLLEPRPDGKGAIATGKIIKVQAKSESSYVKQDSASSFVTPVRQEDLELWTNANYPVIFIVYLRSALSAIDDAIRSLKRAKNASDDETEIRKALHELEDAESDIKRAIHDLPDE